MSFSGQPDSWAWRPWAPESAFNPEPAHITSDILPMPLPTATVPSPSLSSFDVGPTYVISPTASEASTPPYRTSHVVQAVAPSSAPVLDIGLFQPNSRYDQEGRDAMGDSLKKRWASGSMDDAMRKRQVTMQKQTEFNGFVAARRSSQGPTQAHRAPLKELLADKPPSVQRTWPGEDSPQQHGWDSDGQMDGLDGASASSGASFPRPSDYKHAHDEVADQGQESESDGGVDFFTENPVPAAWFKGKWYTALEYTPSGRLYKSMPKALVEACEVNSSCGLLIPDGYKQCPDFKGFPWICPIRSCRRVFASVVQLGGHFNAQHKNMALHDNLDGTLSICGPHSQGQLRPGRHYHQDTIRRRTVIISRGPISDAPDEPLATPSLTPKDMLLLGLVAPSTETETAIVKRPATQFTVATRTTRRDEKSREERDSLVRQQLLKEQREQLIANSNLSRNEHLSENDDIADPSWEASDADEAGDSVEADLVTGEDDVEQVELSLVTNFPTPLMEAEPGRPYTMFRDKSGSLIGVFGVVIPTGYQHNMENAPWLCPMRYCQKPCKRRQDLAYHFLRKHYAALLNDNEDGTFSVLGFYAAKTVKNNMLVNKSPPLVISKGPLPADWKPIPELNPFHDSSVARIPVIKASSALKPSPKTSPAVVDETALVLVSKTGSNSPNPLPAAPAPQPGSSSLTGAAFSWSGEPGGPAERLWESIRHHFRSKTPPLAINLKELLDVPQKRPLRMGPQHLIKPYFEKYPRDVAAMVLQITGEVAPTPCKRCAEGTNIFDECVVISRTAHPEARARYLACASCVYRNLQSACNLKHWVTSRDQPPYPLNTKSAPGKAKAHKPPAGGDNQQVQQSLKGLKVPAGSKAVANGADPGPQRFSTETWEIAPGRIRSAAASSHDESIAFSKSYVSTPTAVPVCEDVSFRVLTVAGEKLSLPVEPDKTQICSVATGKVRVSLGDEPEFLIGQHGIFKVKPGVACEVRNAVLVDAVLHVTMLSGFE